MTSEPVSSAAVTYRALVERVEQVVRSIDVAEDDAPTVQKLVAAATRALGHLLGLSGGRIYVRESADYRLWMNCLIEDAGCPQGQYDLQVTGEGKGPAGREAEIA